MVTQILFMSKHGRPEIIGIALVFVRPMSTSLRPRLLSCKISERRLL